MKMRQCAWFAAALAAALVTTTAPAFAQGSYVEPFVMKNRAPGMLWSAWLPEGLAPGSPLTALVPARTTAPAVSPVGGDPNG